MAKERDNNDVPEIDPELAEDLGAEFELRGDQLETALEEARAEASRNLDAAQRVQAEFENYRKRMAREQEDAIKRSGERIVLQLLPVIDNLERAIAHAGDAGEGDELRNGVEMVLGQMLDILEKEGTTQIDPLDQPFDAMSHQAVGQAQHTEVPEGTVVEVYQKGYTMHGRVIRPAMVIVSTGGPVPEE